MIKVHVFSSYTSVNTKIGIRLTNSQVCFYSHIIRCFLKATDDMREVNYFILFNLQYYTFYKPHPHLHFGE